MISSAPSTTGENQAVGADDEARARAAAFRLLARAHEGQHREAEAAEDLGVSFVQSVKGACAFNDAGFADSGNVDDALAVLFHQLHEIGQLLGLRCGHRSNFLSLGGTDAEHGAGHQNGGAHGDRNRLDCVSKKQGHNS